MAGMVFLETTHHGSDTALYDVWLAQAVAHNKSLLEPLKKVSTALFENTRDSETSSRDADMMCFYGGKKEAAY